MKTLFLEIPRVNLDLGILIFGLIALSAFSICMAYLYYSENCKIRKAIGDGAYEQITKGSIVQVRDDRLQQINKYISMRVSSAGSRTRRQTNHILFKLRDIYNGKTNKDGSTEIRISNEV